MTALELGDAAGQNPDVVRGWESAAELAGRSVASVRKLVDGGRLRAEKAPDGVHVFERSDLLALPPVVRGAETETSADTRLGARADAASEPPSPPQLAPPVTRAETTRSDSLDGSIAAEMFGFFEAGRAPVEVVIAMKQSPSVVESAYAAWQRMKALDTTSTEAQSRIATLERTAQELRDALEQAIATIDAHDPLVAQFSTAAWRQRQSIDSLLTRMLALERRRPPGDELSELPRLRQRLAAVEQLVRALPAAPLAIGVPCSACGHQLVVAASCTGCGAGRAAVG